MNQNEMLKSEQAVADLQDLNIETFQIEEISNLDMNTALEDIDISLCSSTCSSCCG